MADQAQQSIDREGEPISADPRRPDGQVPAEITRPKNFVLWALLFELSLAAVALAVAMLFGFYDRAQPLWNLESIPWVRGLVWGLLGTVPLFLLVIWLDRASGAFCHTIQRTADRLLEPLFRGTSLLAIAAISLAAGIGEELVFRWCLQSGIAGRLDPAIGVWVGLLASSLVFGICHWINFPYAVLTGLIGCYFGMMMISSGTVIAPITCHAVYDGVALFYLTRLRGRAASRSEPGTFSD